MCSQQSLVHLPTSLIRSGETSGRDASVVQPPRRRDWDPPWKARPSALDARVQSRAESRARVGGAQPSGGAKKGVVWTGGAPEYHIPLHEADWAGGSSISGNAALHRVQVRLAATDRQDQRWDTAGGALQLHVAYTQEMV